MSLGLALQTAKAEGLKTISSILMAGGVQVAQHIKKMRVRVDINGNEIDPKSGEFLGSVDESQYTPTPQELASAQEKRGGEEKVTPEQLEELNSQKTVEAVYVPSTIPVNPSSGTIAQAVQSALREQISVAVGEAIKQIDIKEMIKEAVKNAF